MNNFYGLLRSTRAATAIEYGLILALVFLAMVTTVKSVGTSTIGMWNHVSDTSSNAMSGG